MSGRRAKGEGRMGSPAASGLQASDRDPARYMAGAQMVLVSLPKALVKDLIDARTACEECPDLNAGDQQRANLNELQIMKRVCELVRKVFRP